MSNVDHPEYYKAGGIEAIDVIEDWKLDFCLEKAAWYIKHHAEGVKAGTIPPIPPQENTKYDAEDVCEAWGVCEDNLFWAIINLYYGVVVPDKESMYQESIKTVYYDLIRHITYYV